MISLAQLRGEIPFPFLSLLGELVQGSAIFWMWLSLGSLFLLVMEPDTWRGVWAGEDRIGDDCPWGRGFVFVWDRVYYLEGLGLLLEGLVLGSAMFCPILNLWLTILLEGGGCSVFWGWGKCLGVYCRFYLYLGYSLL